jgi:ribonuclease PH
MSQGSYFSPGSRSDQRRADQLRPIQYTLDFAPYAEGSILLQAGDTRVLCTASVEERAPSWISEPGKGWVTAEYSMLPRATQVRTKRDQVRQGGRTQEIQRLIGRSLRAVTDLKALGSRSIVLDCDVLQADAGTRTAAITGAWVALALACDRLQRQGTIPRFPLLDQVAAVSLGLLGDEILLDLNYLEDSKAGVDLNLVMTGAGRLVEVQGTAENSTFDRQQLDQMIELGSTGLQSLFAMQRQALTDKGIKFVPKTS